MFKKIALIFFIIALLSYGVWTEYRLYISKKTAKSLENKNSEYIKELVNINQKYASSTKEFDDLYQVLTTAINEEGLKNKTLEEKVLSLDKLARSDTQLLKKYSKVYFLNENYKPVETQSILSDYIFNKKQEYRLHVDVIYFLQKMIDDARSQGLDILVISAYRSFETQASLKSRNKSVYGAKTANRFVAEQGYSEHQLGTTLDFTTTKLGGISVNFDKTKEYIWLQENAHRYGFTLSYPKGNQYYAYEPWHWRFVGKALATQIYNDKINFYNLDQRYIDGYLVGMFDR